VTRKSVMRIRTVALAALLSGCTVAVDQKSLLPDLKPPTASLQAPPGYTLTAHSIPLGDLGAISAVHLTSATSRGTIIFSGGSGWQMANGSRRAAQLAEATGANIILYDYPGRGSTTVPATADALEQAGPGFVAALRTSGLIGPGPVIAHGFSFGGSQAAAMARNGGVDALVLEATTADIDAMAGRMVPGGLKPFVRVKIEDRLKAFDYAGHATAAGVPILLIAGTADTMVPPDLVAAFAADLAARGLQVTTVTTSGNHGGAFATAEGQAGLATFLNGLPAR
jgi:pimeloyl-ACP methyl ester carboxylesterase